MKGPTPFVDRLAAASGTFGQPTPPRPPRIPPFVGAILIYAAALGVMASLHRVIF